MGSVKVVCYVVIRILVAALSVRTAFLVTSYLLGQSAQRFQVESATFVFSIVGTAAVFLGDRPNEPLSKPRSLHPWWWLSFVAVALLIYWQTLSIGLLSDDFVLVDRARHWLLGPVGPQLFRPLPIALWALILALGGGAVAFHLLNLILHGTNAYLTSVILLRRNCSYSVSYLGGLVLLTIPIAVEAVAWSSGIFDLLMTTIVCAAVVTADQYSDNTPPVRRLCLYGLAVAGLLTKETAIVLPALVLLEAWARSNGSRELKVDLIGLLGLSVLFAIVRLTATGAAAIAKAPSKYLIQLWIFRVFGGLAVPWHTEVVRSWPALPIGTALLVLFIVTCFFTMRQSSQQVKNWCSGALWVLIAVGPVLTIMFIAPDLQGSRYLYLPAVGWSALLTSAATRTAGRGRFMEAITVMTLIGLVALFAVGDRLHTRYWVSAGAKRQQVESSAATDSRLRSCGVVSLKDVPDNEAGAYVFRNGTAEAFRADIGLTVDPSAAPESCTFRWVGDHFVIDR